MNVAEPRRPIVILISGRGSNMRALIERSRDADCPYRVTQVFSDNADAAGLAAARELGIPALALPLGAGTDRATYDRTLARQIERTAPALIVLAGFMRILSKEFVAAFAGRILNIHPSLLPKFPGLHTHRRVLEARETEHGATVHFVTEQLDAGPQVIQGKLTIEARDDERSLAMRIQALEHQVYPLAVRWYCEGRLEYRAGRAWLDGRTLLEPVLYAPTPVLEPIK